MRGAGERVGCRGLPGCSIMRAFLTVANIGVLCAAARSPCICSRLRVALRFAQQPTGLTLPCGARMVSLPSQISAFCALAAHSPCICSRLQVALGLWPKCPQGTRFLSAHLQVALGLRPKCPQGTRFPARLPGVGAVPGRSIVAEGAGRAHRSFLSLANIGVLCAGRAQPLYLLTPPGRFGPLAQQPTGLTLPSGVPKTCAAAQKESVASAQRAQETRHAPPFQKSHQRPFASIKKKPPAPHKRERAATRPAGSIRQTDSPSDTAATRAGCRRCP